ncbi:MAG: RluA family pseudouridine synthase [Myxococcales bacterium]|nr:RluA family pseudouridine synthase [Myxococcales bacterium]
MAKKQVFTVAVDDPRELVSLLASRLLLSLDVARRLHQQGSVWIDGKRAQPAQYMVSIGQRLTVFVPDPQPALPSPRVVYEDRALLVVDKPAGLPCQPGRQGGPSLLTVLGGSLWLPHRLDAETSGLTMLARSSESCARLSAQLSSGQIKRRYLAKVVGIPTERGLITLRIGRAHGSGPPKMRAYPAHASEGDSAETRFVRLATRQAAHGPESLLLVELQTGRTHQVRVHLAAIGHPLVGDTLYGGPSQDRLSLHAAFLSLRQPLTGQKLAFSAELPVEIWPTLPGNLPSLDAAL